MVGLSATGVGIALVTGALAKLIMDHTTGHLVRPSYGRYQLPTLAAGALDAGPARQACM